MGSRWSPSILVEADSIWVMKCRLMVMPLRAASAFTFLL